MSSPLSKPQIIAHIQKSLNYTVFDSKWIPCSAKFVCLGNFARGTGVLQIYEVQHGEAQLIKEVDSSRVLYFFTCENPLVNVLISNTPSESSRKTLARIHGYSKADA